MKFFTRFALAFSGIRSAISRDRTKMMGKVFPPDPWPDPPLQKTPEEIVVELDEREDTLNKDTQRQAIDFQQHFYQQMHDLYYNRAIELEKLHELREAALAKCAPDPQPDADGCACSCDRETCCFDTGPSASFTHKQSEPGDLVRVYVTDIETYRRYNAAVGAALARKETHDDDSAI